MKIIMPSIFKKNNKVIYISLIIAIMGIVYLSSRYDKGGEITSFGCKMHPNCHNKDTFNNKIKEERFISINRYCQNQQNNFRVEKNAKVKNCNYYNLMKKLPKEYSLDKANYRSISSKDSDSNEKVFKNNGYENYKKYGNVYQYKTEISP